LTIVVLLILVLVWAVVLGPSLLRRGFQRRSSTDSIGAFHRQLRVLQRTGPTLVDPLHRLDVSLPATHIGARTRPGRPGLIVVSPDMTLPVSEESANDSSARRPDPYFRPEACKRRRDVLIALLLAVVVTGLPGAIPSARPILAVTAVAAIALVGYIALLVRLRTRALERQVKLRYLPQPADRDSSIVIRRVAAR